MNQANYDIQKLILSKYIDNDIKEAFSKEYQDSDGKMQPAMYFISSPHLVMVNLQLVRALNEAFSRGFIVKE